LTGLIFEGVGWPGPCAGPGTICRRVVKAEQHWL
jgi:hypothetical protein